MDLTKINIKQYRIKTEEEFEKDFGEYWQSFSYSHLLGCNLSDLEIVSKHETRIEIKDFNKGIWYISEYMITTNIKKKEKIQWI